MLSSNGVLPELKVYRIELVAPSHRSAKSLFSFVNSVDRFLQLWFEPAATGNSCVRAMWVGADLMTSIRLLT